MAHMRQKSRTDNLDTFFASQRSTCESRSPGNTSNKAKICGRNVGEVASYFRDIFGTSMLLCNCRPTYLSGSDLPISVNDDRCARMAVHEL